MSRGREQFDLIPNTSTWEERVELWDDESSKPVNLHVEVHNITLRLRDPYTQAVEYTADIPSGVVFLIPSILVPETELGLQHGTFGWKIPANTMRGIYPKTYEIGVLMDILNETHQLILGQVSIVRGL